VNPSLFVAWRGGEQDSGRWGPVGRLEHIADGYRFMYTRGARSLQGFVPFPEMEELDVVYESDALFPIFANRLLSPSRPEYEAFLTWGGFDPDNPPDPIALLGVTEGMRATDSLEVFPCPLPDADGCFINKFFLHGVRWFSSALPRIATLKPGDSLGLMLDISNRHDPLAVAVRTCDVHDRFMIGYVPRYLARDVGELCARCDPDFIQLKVERVNPSAPLQQRVLCRMKACWPQEFRPCRGEEFQPIVAELAAVA
jgi:hypothetical protein